MAAHHHPHDHHDNHGWTAKGHEGHGHTIVPMFTLRFILTALVLLTLLTVGAARAESWIANTFDVGIPTWVNVCVALSIAVVKTALVVGFFMQLRYDNPLNTVVFVFTVFTALCFLGFTFADIGIRGSLDRVKAEYIVPGGTGNLQVSTLRKRAAEAGVQSEIDFNRPITEIARQLAIITGDSHLKADAHEDHHDHAGSTGDRSRPVTGLTLPGFAPDSDEHGDTPPDDSDAESSPEHSAGH